ncbi:MAG: hypothetical protein MI757_09635 [Pirellulales bacterium]|nr:hypothetical protein [Pirellulales bacterium]
MANNPILDELRATRERLLAESGGTVSGLLDRLRADQAASNRPTYTPSSDNNAMHPGGEATMSEPTK